MMWNFGLVRDAAEQFVGDLLPDDRARIGNFSNRVQIDPETFTSDRKELVRILHENLQDAGPTPLWNATSAAMNALESQGGRRVVLVFTDGKDSPPNPTGNATFWQVLDGSQKDEIMVYAIGLANSCGLPSSPASSSPAASSPRSSSAESRSRPARSSSAAAGCRAGRRFGSRSADASGSRRWAFRASSRTATGDAENAAKRARLDDLGQRLHGDEA